MPNTIREDTTFIGRVIFRVLPAQTSAILDSSTTPDISNLLLVKGSGVVVTVTNFVGGQDSQQLRVIGDGTTTVANGTHIKTSTGANKLLAANKVYTFSYYAPTLTWYENA